MLLSHRFLRHRYDPLLPQPQILPQSRCYTLGHLEWILKTYGKGSPADDGWFTDIKRLLTEQREFQDSRQSLGLQLVDMLASVLRRALNDRLRQEGWENFGQLIVRKERPVRSIVALERGTNEPVLLTGHALTVCEILDAHTKSMFISSSEM